jgi:hypothetical protein
MDHNLGNSAIGPDLSLYANVLSAETPLGSGYVPSILSPDHDGEGLGRIPAVQVEKGGTPPDSPEIGRLQHFSANHSVLSYMPIGLAGTDRGMQENHPRQNTRYGRSDR